MAIVDSAAHSSPSRESRGDILATLPLVALGAVLLWFALAQGNFDPVMRPHEAAVTRSAKSGVAQTAGTSQPMVEAPVFIVVFPAERAAAVSALVSAEATLRTALGEPPRRVEVIGAVDFAEAEAIAVAIRDDFGSFPELGFSTLVLP